MKKNNLKFPFTNMEEFSEALKEQVMKKVKPELDKVFQDLEKEIDILCKIKFKEGCNFAIDKVNEIIDNCSTTISKDYATGKQITTINVKELKQSISGIKSSLHRERSKA